jgi:molybdate transport system ATP-binding protein
MIKLNLKKALDAMDGKMELNVAMKIRKNSLTTIFGESGAGKTSILRMISGLMDPDNGNIEVNGKTWYNSSAGINLKTQNRRIGYVFQDYALFPNMTVKENLTYALEKRQDPGIVSELLDIIELENLKNRKSGTLSGGQKQRVSLARALVGNPDILLLDEPLSALDEGIRSKLQDYILMVHEKYKLTTILVSHDLPEIFKLSDQIFLLKKGKIERSGTPSEVFLSNNISGKYRFTGTIIEKTKNDVVYVVGVLVGNNLIKVIATDDEGDSLNIGDRVMVVSKAFNPLIMKLNQGKE